MCIINPLKSTYHEYCFELSAAAQKNRIKDIQVVLAGTLTGVQSDIRCKGLAALSTAK